MTTKYLLECYYDAKCPIAVAQCGSTESELIPESLVPYPGDNKQEVENQGNVASPVAVDNARQMQRIRALGVNLRQVADQMRIRHEDSFLNLGALHREGLSNEEIQVVRRIYAERASTALSTIAMHLKGCLTPRTFQMALSFLSSNISTDFEQLAAACELVTLLYPRVQQAIQAGRIYDVLQEFINDKLDEVLH